MYNGGCTFNEPDYENCKHDLILVDLNKNQKSISLYVLGLWSIFEGASPLKFPAGGCTAGPVCFWIKSPQRTGSRASLVSVSESGSQKYSSPQFTTKQKSTISQKLKITHKNNS